MQLFRIVLFTSQCNGRRVPIQSSGLIDCYTNTPTEDSAKLDSGSKCIRAVVWPAYCLKQANCLRLAPEVHLNPAGNTGPACGWVSAPNSPPSRLPLHIQYRLTKPGTYLVRYTFRYIGVIVQQSDWTPVEVRTPPPKVIRDWLSSQLRNLPTSPGLLVGDALPSLLASREGEVVRVMLEATYNPDEIVSGYASNTIPMFDAEMVRAETLEIVRRRGPSDALANAFGSYGGVLLPIAEQVAAITVPYLHSSDPDQIEAAIHIASVLKDPYYRLSSSTIQRLNAVAEQAVDVVIAQRNEKAASWLAQYIAVSKMPSAREILWKIADNGLGGETVLICISWLHNLDDLPKLAGIAGTYDAGDPYGYKNSGVVMDLRSAYGDAIKPYFRDLLKKSQQLWVRVAAAKDLALLGEPAGYQFFINVLEQTPKPFYHDEMVRWLKSAFPPIATADDAEILKFLRSRTQSSSSGRNCQPRNHLLEVADGSHSRTGERSMSANSEALFIVSAKRNLVSASQGNRAFAGYPLYVTTSSLAAVQLLSVQHPVFDRQQACCRSFVES
jgi:hypothetical protein